MGSSTSWPAGKTIVAADDYVFQTDLTLDTDAYAAGDTLADLVEVTNAVAKTDGVGILHSVSVVDVDDQGAAIDLLFYRSSITLASKNAAWAISDSDSKKFLGHVRIESGDWIDLGDEQIATKTSVGLPVWADSGTSIYMATVSQGSPTYAADGLSVTLGFLR